MVNTKLETRNLKISLLGDLRSRRLGRKQNINQLIERRVGLLVHFFDFDRADGMLHDQHRMIRRAESFLLGFCQRHESVGDQCDREPAALLNFEGVVDTPRRAGASITQAADDEVGLRRELVEILFRRALLRGQFAPGDHVGHAVLFF